MKVEPLDGVEVELLRRTIGHRVALARVRLGLSQRALARTMRRSPSWVREVEEGSQFAPAYLLVALARATSLPIGWFYNRDDALGSPAGVAEDAGKPNAHV